MRISTYFLLFKFDPSQSIWVMVSVLVKEKRFLLTYLSGLVKVDLHCGETFHSL